MLALSRRTNKTIAAPKKANTTAKDTSSDCSPLHVRDEKVRSIQRQLAEGGYDLDKRMNVAFDKLWEKLAEFAT